MFTNCVYACVFDTVYILLYMCIKTGVSNSSKQFFLVVVG